VIPMKEKNNKSAAVSNANRSAEEKSPTRENHEAAGKSGIPEVLRKKGKIKGVNTFPHIPPYERWIGARDGRKKQVCELNNGHTTPRVRKLERNYNSYVDWIYTMVISTEEPEIKKAYCMILELDDLLTETDEEVFGEGEEANRMRRHAEAKKNQRRSRKLEILSELASMRAHFLLVDEAMSHFTESAGNSLDAVVSSYWRGIRSTTPESVDFYPVMETKDQPGRKKYETNRDDLIAAIDASIEKGSDTYEKE